MPAAVNTKTTELGDSRVRLDVEVPSDALEREMQSAASAIGREMRVPGFRSGKVPAQVVIQQVGREAVLDEAVRRGLPGWYEEAVTVAGINTVGDPKVDLSDLPEKGSPLAFTIEVGIVPPARLGDYKGVEVGRREPKVDPDQVQTELERLREALASLETVDRPAASGDFVVIDFSGTVDSEAFQGGDGRGQVVELGSERLVPGFEEQLEGARAGDEREVRVTFPDDYSAEELAGKEAAFAVEVKEVKQKRLPSLDDDFAVEAGGDDSLDPRRYLELSGKTEEDLVTESEPDAELALKREAVLAEIVKAEGIEVSDEEVTEALREAAGPDATDKQVKRALKRARSQGADEALREDIAMRKAVDLLVEHAKPIPAEQAAAREKLWTPEKEQERGAGQIWTPGS